MTEIMNFQLIVAYRRVEETDIEQVLLDLLTKVLEDNLIALSRVARGFNHTFHDLLVLNEDISRELEARTQFANLFDSELALSRQEH